MKLDGGVLLGAEGHVVVGLKALGILLLCGGSLATGAAITDF